MSTQTAEILMDAETLAPEMPGIPLDDVTDERNDETADEAGVEAAEPEADETAAAAEVEDVARIVPLLEGMLFAAGAPVPVPRLVDALDGPDRRQVLQALELLAERLVEDGRGVRLARVAGGYQLRTIAEHGPWIRRLLGGKPPRLSRAMLETLAIIAYRQPCTKPEIELIRGVDVDAVLSTLVDRRMVRLVGRKEAPGRPILYGTTKEFLEVFSLPDLEALPPLKDLGELADALAAREADAGLGASDPVPPVEPAATPAEEQGDVDVSDTPGE